jgi:hypothetical protein
LTLGLVLVPGFAEACAVCSAGREDETRTAFIVSTAGMTLLPLLLVGGLVLWLRKRFREVEAEDSDRGPIA